MNKAQNLPSMAFVATVMSGPDKGNAFVLAGSRITIGRSNENNIILTDPKCSREHAVIEVTPLGLKVSDLGSQHGMSVNGKIVKSSILSPGSSFTIGSTVLQVGTTSVGSIFPSNSEVGAVSSHVSDPFAPETLPKKKNSNFLILVLGLVAVSIFILRSKKTNQPTLPAIRTNHNIDLEIDETKRRQDELSRRIVVSGKNTQAYKDAQASFIKGFRDYREGNYRRSMQFFSAAISLYPDHPLAQRYFDLSKRKHDEQIQNALLEAKRYTELNQYRLALSAYKRVMYLIDETSHRTYIEAKERKQEIELILQEAF